MNDYLNNIKPAIRAIKAYQLKERSCRIKLNQNENPFDLPAEFKQEILAEFATLAWNRYPSFYNSTLKTALARHLHFPDDTILVGNGSNELLQIVFNAVLEGGKTLLLVTPTFTIYQQLGSVTGAQLREIQLAPDWSFPVEEIESYVDSHDVALTVLCSTNSPTGSLLSEENLRRIVVASKGLVLLDEAYHEFSGMDYLSLLRKNANLMITRTFSKAMGLAGLRIGYILSHKDLIVELNKGKLPYNLNIFAELVARRLLENYRYVETQVGLLVKERERVFLALGHIPGITVYRSAANFLMFSTPMPSEQVLEKVEASSILIRDIAGYHPRLRNTLRASIGKPEENDALLAALRTLF
jgi:histidinol-phosphate aminotransferase